jgi:hypothetical protein
MALLVGCNVNPWASSEKEGPEMTVYYSNSCTCCKRYVQYLREHGFSVEQRLRTNRGLQGVKNKHGIGSSMQSCHTAVVGDYVVEGHVPVEAIERLLEEAPNVKGISVPGMPRHSPGMGPPAGELLSVYSFGNDDYRGSLFTEVSY